MIRLLIFLESRSCWLWDTRNPSSTSRPIWLLWIFSASFRIVPTLREICEQRLDKVKTARHGMKAHLYKHIFEDVSALLNPDTFQVLGEADPRLKEFLSHTSMEELIALQIFKFEKAMDFVIDTVVVDGPVPEQVYIIS